MSKKTLESYGIEYLLSTNGINTTVYVPKTNDLGIGSCNHFGLFKPCGKILTKDLVSCLITNPQIVADNLEELENEFSKRKIRSRANSILNIQSSADIFSNQGYSYLLYNIDALKIKNYR